MDGIACLVLWQTTMRGARPSMAKTFGSRMHVGEEEAFERAVPSTEPADRGGRYAGDADHRSWIVERQRKRNVHVLWWMRLLGSFQSPICRHEGRGGSIRCLCTSIVRGFERGRPRDVQDRSNSDTSPVRRQGHVSWFGSAPAPAASSSFKLPRRLAPSRAHVLHHPLPASRLSIASCRTWTCRLPPHPSRAWFPFRFRFLIGNFLRVRSADLSGLQRDRHRVRTQEGTHLVRRRASRWFHERKARRCGLQGSRTRHIGKKSARK